MKPLELAMKYMDIFYTIGDMKLLKNILTDDFKFIGPYYQFDTSMDYINSLLEDPPINLSYKVVKTYEDDFSACIIYEFLKPGISVLMAQLFEIEGNKIKGIKLIFDSKSL